MIIFNIKWVNNFKCNSFVNYIFLCLLVYSRTYYFVNYIFLCLLVYSRTYYFVNYIFF